MTKNFTNFLETIVFTDDLGHQARTTKQRDWLPEIEQTTKHDYNFHDFCLTYYWLLIFVFKYKKSSYSQVTDGLKQFSDLYLWIKLKHFSVLSALSLQKLETSGF